jgi:hypothetical protein
MKRKKQYPKPRLPKEALFRLSRSGPQTTRKNKKGYDRNREKADLLKLDKSD